jgi:DNA-binding GntR family transcriptional regulator
MSEAVGKPQFQVNRLERSTLLDHVYRQLTELILDGEIAPGQSITINSLADAFGVSAMPVREALQRLTAERVLTVISGRTIGVPPLSAERFYDLLRVRLEVEALASEWASEFITADDLAQLESFINEMDTTIQS